MVPVVLLRRKCLKIRHSAIRHSSLAIFKKSIFGANKKVHFQEIPKNGLFI